MSPVAPSKQAPSSGSILSQLRDAKSQITPAQRFWLASAGILLLTLAIGVVGIQLPWQEHRQQLSSRYNEERERSELLLAMQRQKVELQGLEQKFLLEGGATGLAGRVSQLAAQSGLQIESVTPQPEVLLEPYTRFQIEIAASSNLANVLRFLRSLEEHRPLLWVEQMEIGEPSSQENSGMAGEDKRPVEARAQQKVKLLIGAVARQKAS